MKYETTSLNTLKEAIALAVFAYLYSGAEVFMKKKITVIIFILSIICNMTSCKPAYKEDTENKEEKRGSITDVKTDIIHLEDIDWNTKHLNCRLSERVTIDADIVPDSIWKQKFGLYHYRINKNQEALIDKEKTEELAEVLDNYYGRNVTLIEKNMTNPTKQIENPMVRSEDSSIFFTLENTIHDYIMSNILEASCPVKITGYDKEAVNSKVQELQELLYEYTHINQSSYDVYWFGKDMYTKLADIQKKYGSGDCLGEEVMERQEEFFEIRIRPVLDFGITVKRIPNISFEPLDGENASEFIQKDGKGYDMVKMGENILDIVLDNQYEMIMVSSQKTLDIEEEPFESVEIFGLDEILQKFMERNKSSNIAVLDVSMYYSATASEQLDNENNRDVYLAPFWVVTYHSGSSTSNYQYVFSAVTGELVYSLE